MRLPFAAFIGGLVATLVLVTVAGRHGQLMIGTLLLAGIAIAAIAERNDRSHLLRQR